MYSTSKKSKSFILLFFKKFCRKTKIFNIHRSKNLTKKRKKQKKIKSKTNIMNLNSSQKFLINYKRF